MCNVYIVLYPAFVGKCSNEIHRQNCICEPFVSRMTQCFALILYELFHFVTGIKHFSTYIIIILYYMIVWHKFISQPNNRTTNQPTNVLSHLIFAFAFKCTQISILALTNNLRHIITCTENNKIVVCFVLFGFSFLKTYSNVATDKNCKRFSQ